VPSTPVAAHARAASRPAGGRGAARALDRLFGIDARSLAAFRIALGALVVVDLLTRAADIEQHYSDAGVLPREAFRRLFALSKWHWSLHLWTGSVAGEAVLFVVAAVAAVALIVGYRTRLATAITWLLMVSLQARNPMILYGADQLLRMLLLWSLFLPLGAAWSIDRLRGAVPEGPPRRHLSIATAAILLQPCLMYVFSGLLKQNPSWHSGSALSYALSSDIFATPLGHALLAYPEVLEQVTYVVPWFELLVPIALFVPWATVVFRTAALLVLAAFHVTLGLVFATGLFQFAAATGLVLFVPSEVWDRLARAKPLHDRAVQIADRMAPFFRAHVAPATRPPRIWIQGGLQTVVAGLFLYVVAWNIAGLKVEEYSARHTLTWAREWWASGHSGLALMFKDDVVERMMGDFGWIGRVANLQQRWDMFYRTGAEERGWHLIVGTLEDGRQISLLEGGRPFDGATHRRPDSVRALYPNARWATYFTYLRTPGADPARRLLPPVISRAWDRQHPDAKIEALRILFVQDSPAPHGGGPEWREVVWYEGPPYGADSPSQLADEHVAFAVNAHTVTRRELARRNRRQGETEV